MKKIILAGLLVGCGLMGAENVSFIGASIGNAELQTSVGEGSFESNNDATHYTGTVGQYVGENARVSLSYTYVEPTGNVKHSDGLSLAIDFVLPVVEDTFLLYVGPVVGYTRFEEEASGLDLDLSGLHYGAQAGAIVRIVKNIEIEGGYRYLVETGSDSVLGASVEADDLRMWYVGANFRF